MKNKKFKVKQIFSSLFSIALIFFTLQTGYRAYTTYREVKLAEEATVIYETAKKEDRVLHRPIPSQSPALEAIPTPEPVELIVRPEFEALRAQYNNDDIIGFISIEGTSISYPVLQYFDNDFYLSRDIHGRNNSAGSIFLDHENNIDALDMNTIIYGHNMKDDIMFHAIRNYKDYAFWQDHKYIQFNTIYDDMVFEVFAYYTPRDSFPYIYANYEEHVFENLLAQIKKMAYYDTGIDIGGNDKIIHLSTCTNTTDDTRMAIAGKLIELNGEKIQN